MSDRDALLAAIRANPDDDTPRLVFADWLDEHEPDTGRRGKKTKAHAPSSWAALIRTECELARLEDEDTPAAALLRFFIEKDGQSLAGVRWDRVEPGVGRLIELRTLAHQLRPAASRGAEPPNGNAGAEARGDSTRRGFPDAFHLTDDRAFASRLPEWVKFCPPVKVTLPLPLTNPDALVQAGFARWCQELRLTAGFGGHRELLASLSRVSETAGIRTLRLSAAHGLETGLAIMSVMESPNWAGLRELSLNLEAPDLPERNLAEEALALLFRAPHLRGLRRLKLTNCARTAELLPLVAALPELRELDLTGSGLGDAGAEQLANAPALANLRHLDLQNNNITGRGASALLASPHLRGLVVLDLDHNPVRDLDRAALATAPAGGLRTIGFHGARLKARDITALTTSPRLSELVYFDADANALPETAVARLVRGFGARPPAVLYLTSNGIGEVGVGALTAWPEAVNIDMLHLSGNALPAGAAKALAACPYLQQLSHLCAGCADPDGRKALKARFGARAIV